MGRLELVYRYGTIDVTQMPTQLRNHMTIEQIATELLAIKVQVAEIECQYTAKRDEMYGALSTYPNHIFVQGGYRFQRTNSAQAVTVNKQSVIGALLAENLSAEVLNRIIGAALVESDRVGGLRITPVVPA